MKPLYMPIFMIVDAPVFEFREFRKSLDFRPSEVVLNNMATRSHRDLGGNSFTACSCQSYNYSQLHVPVCASYM